MRPRSYVQSVILYHLQNEVGDHIPMKVEVNSWVGLELEKRGGHAREAKKHGNYLARILKFKLCPNGSTVSAIQVQHAYSRQQLKLNPRDVLAKEACNFKTYIHQNMTIGFHLLVIVQVICVYHAEIGEASKGSRSHRQLMEESVYFYNSWYHPSTTGGFGRIEAIPLPLFDDPACWPLPDMETTEAFRSKMREDFLSAMKPSTKSQVTHISWFMPINIMVDLFVVSTNIHKTRTLFVFQDNSQEVFDSLMDKGWNERIYLGADEIKCCVDLASVIFKYHVGRTTLYSNYQYNRLRLRVGGMWQPMDQAGPIHIVKILCKMNEWQQELEVGHNWTLNSLRSEVEMALGASATFEFTFYIINEDQQSTKVNRRHEKNRTTGDVLPPRLLKVVLDE